MLHLLALCLLLIGGGETLAPDQELYLQGAQAFDRDDFGVAMTSFEALLHRHSSSSLACPAHYALAETYYSLQQYQKALAELDAVDSPCETRVGRGRVQWRRAWVLYHLGRLPAAGEAFQQASTSPDLSANDQTAAMVMVGDVAMEQGRAADALSAYRRVVQRNMPSPLLCQIHYKIGRAALTEGAFTEAQTAFATVVQLDSRSEFADDAVYGRAWALRKQKKHEGARAAWHQLIVTYAQSPLALEARFRMGEEYYSLGKYQEAIMAFDTVPAASDFADHAMYWKAWAEYRLDQFSKAAYTFSLIRTSFPRSRLATDSQFRAADAHREAGQYELALRGYRVLVEMKPSEEYLVESLYGMAQSAAFSGDLSAAENYRTQLLSTGKAGDFAPRAFFDLGVAAYNRKQYGRAIREFSTLLSQYPAHSLANETWYHLGLSHLRDERYGEARNAFQRTIKAAPNSETASLAAYQLGWAYFRDGEFDRAAEQFNEVSRRGGPRATDALYRSGDALYNAGRYTDAIAVYQQVIDMAPGSELAATAQNSIGWCYERLSRPAEAIGAFHVVVDRYPQSLVWDDSAYKIAEYYHGAGDYTLSIPILEALRSAPGSPFWESSLLMLGSDLWKTGRKREARSVIESLLSRRDSPLRPDGLLLLADASWDDRDWDQAQARYAQFAEEYPSSESAALAFLRVAESYAAQELWDKAAEAFTRASVAGAPRASCLAGTCKAAANVGRCAEAENAARTMETDFPTDARTADAQFWAGNCYVGTGDDETAARLLLKVPILYPDSDQADDALLLAARARLRQGRGDQAERHLRLLLEKYPASELRGQAERLLASMEGGTR
ncbi:tetratricopeptide repeat protein [Candidatus Fermentibacteria bacterium]|nr:tetratricopeptide repeat protein [Candidatus Fermentibacteria bacterium]